MTLHKAKFMLSCTVGGYALLVASVLPAITGHLRITAAVMFVGVAMISIPSISSMREANRTDMSRRMPAAIGVGLAVGDGGGGGHGCYR